MEKVFLPTIKGSAFCSSNGLFYPIIINMNKFLIILLFLNIFLKAYGESGEIGKFQMLEMLKFEKKQAEIIVDKLAERGRVNNEDASRIKRDIASIVEEEKNELENK